MKKLFLAAALALLPVAASAAPSTTTIPAQGGPIRIKAIFHGTVQIEHGGKVIVVDPFSPGSYDKKADVILITHTHGDHLDMEAISKLLKPGTMIVAPPAAAGTIPASQMQIAMQVMRNGEGGFPVDNSTSNMGRNRLTWLKVGAVPSYNVVRGPKPGQKFHPKGQFNGYVVTLGGKRLYFAGDTEAVPEMKRLKRIDVAFLPMNLPYTMTPPEAAKAARMFRPRVAIPYHYRYPFNKANNHPQQFANALRRTRIKVRLLDFYPAAAVARAQ
jgi:L-ascorbate metabolism protein UlaG (beta-lactamase superfamily)